MVRIHLGPGFRFGGVAQLGERLLCKQEVIGSIPFASKMDDSLVCVANRQGVSGSPPKQGGSAVLISGDPAQIQNIKIDGS